MAILGSEVTSEFIKFDTFTSDGGVTYGPLSVEVQSPGQIGVHNNGYYQVPSTDYTVSANLTERLITFNVAPQLGNTIVVLHLGIGVVPTSVDDNSIISKTIRDSSVIGPKIALNTINAGYSFNSGGTLFSGDQIDSKAVSGNHISIGTVTGNLFADTSISGNQIVAETITGNLFADTSISGNQIVAETITGNVFGRNSITGDNFQENAIDNRNLAPRSIIGPAIAENTISVEDLNAPTFSTKTAYRIDAYTGAGTYTFTVPVSTSRIRITAVGGGGGSGALVSGFGGGTSGISGGNVGEGGGGAGFVAYIRGPFLPTSRINLTVGSGGTRGEANFNANTATPGNQGGTTRIWNLITANGANISISANGGFGSNAFNAFGFGRSTTPDPYGSSGVGARGGIADLPNVSDPNLIVITYNGYNGNAGHIYPIDTNANVGFNARRSMLGSGSDANPLNNLPVDVYYPTRQGFGSGGVGVAAQAANGYFRQPTSAPGWTPGANGAGGIVIIEY